jgi:hypothetical protein
MDQIIAFDNILFATNHENERKKMWGQVSKKLKMMQQSSSKDIKSVNSRRYIEPEIFEFVQRLSKGYPSKSIIPSEYIDIYSALYQESTYLFIDQRERFKIEKDISRTFGLFSKSNIGAWKENSTNGERLDQYCTSLNNVLLALSHERGYCQGLNFLVAILILCNESDSAAYVFVSYLLKRRHLEILFEAQYPCLLEYMQIFERKLRKYYRSVYNYFKSIGFQSVCYAIEWFTTCFIVTSPGILALGVIDLVLLDVPDIMLKIGLAIVDLLEPRILKTSLEDLQIGFKAMIQTLDAADILTVALSMCFDKSHDRVLEVIIVI